jgi:hypothetical protein
MMSTSQHISFLVEELQRLLKSVEPAAVLVPPRLLRRVIKQHRKVGGLGLLVPHRKCLVIQRDALLGYVTLDELGLPATAHLPRTVLLLVRPEPDRLARMTLEQALVKHWRLLFHARIDQHMQTKLADGSLTAATVRQRIGRLGVTEFNEITLVLGQEGFLLPPETPETIYAEFVAVYLTLRRFDQPLVPHFFPALGNLEAVDALVAEDVDADAIYHGTRLPGAPEPDFLAKTSTQADGLHGLPPEALRPEPAAPVGENTHRWMLAKAEEMDAKGNTVRAAILRTRAAEGANLTLAGARAELSVLSERLRKALELSDADAEQWRKAMLPLLAHSARGGWSQEARFLYDLQSACVDLERGIYAVDLVGWATSLGQLPIKRQLPGHQEVAIVRHLRRAMHRMRLVRLADGDRQQLTELLEHAVEHRERKMRGRFRPLITNALDEVGLVPHNVPEQIGRAKLIEELLDRIIEYGHFNIGNLRDAISRNQLKLPDLKGPVELVLGDPLIRLNRKLAVVLDGVYRRGEIYMRLLHRLSSVAFGTPLGRLLVLFLILPFGLGFFVMITPGIVIEEGEKIAQLVGLMDKPPPPEPKAKTPAQKPPAEGDDDDDDGGEVAPKEGDGANPPLVQDAGPKANKGAQIKQRVRAKVAVAEPPTVDKTSEAKPAKTGHSSHAFPMPNWWGVLGFGIFFLLLIHVTAFRGRVFYGVGKLGRGLQTVLITAPVRLVQLPALQAILHNHFWLLFRRLVFWPVLMAVAGGMIAWSSELDLIGVTSAAFGGLTLGLLLLNTRLGRDAEEYVTDWLLRFWVGFTVDFLPGVLRAILDFFRLCLEAVEQVLYTVNEWLRFRSGESQIAVVIKAILSLVWFWVTYVLRFAINLLIEPQINPIKHFPVVTVSHKVCLPMVPVLRDVLVQQFGLARPRALALAGGIITGIPGIFGFMVWELKENWRLYSSNRARNLKPVLIGSHGETMLRLLKPGFHSGTVPKLFKRLRRAERRGQQQTVRKVLAALHHVEESLAHFVERELLALLRQSRGWGGTAIELEHVHLATNRISVELACPTLGEHPLVFAIDHQHGWLLAGVLESGWLPRLNAEQRQTLAAALAGLYKMAGVDLTREQIDESLPVMKLAVDLTKAGLVVWTGADGTHDALYDLNAGPMLQPRPLNGALPAGMPVLDTTRLEFANVPLAWQEWVRTWERDHGKVDGDRRQLAYALLPVAKT